MLIVISVIVVQVIIFFALTVFFRKLMSKNVSQATRHLDEMSDEYNRKEKDLQLRMEQAKLEAEELLRKARGEAEQLKADCLKQAEKERDSVNPGPQKSGPRLGPNRRHDTPTLDRILPACRASVKT